MGFYAEHARMIRRMKAEALREAFNKVTDLLPHNRRRLAFNEGIRRAADGILLMTNELEKGE